MVKVCILDYDSGNTKSVENIFEKLNTDYCLSNLKKDIINSTHLVLSGVGTYSTAMRKINNNLPLNIVIDEVLNKSKPILGICVFNSSTTLLKKFPVKPLCEPDSVVVWLELTSRIPSVSELKSLLSSKEYLNTKLL